MARNYQDWENLGRDIERIVDRAVNSQDYQKLNQTIRQTVRQAVRETGSTIRESVRQAEIVEEKKQEIALLYGDPRGKSLSGGLQIAGGITLTSLTLAGSIALGVLRFLSGGFLNVSLGWLPLVLLAGGVGLIWNGGRILGRMGRFKTYRKVLGQKTQCALNELARRVGKPLTFVKKELRAMIDQGLFLEGHLDKEETMLITSHETYRSFEQARLQLEHRQRLEAQEKSRQAAVDAQCSPQVREVLDKGNAFIADIRRCNDAIPGEAVSAKIDRMEHIVRQIFRRVEADPASIPDLKKMMDYYLPMTVKLLNAYADMDAQAVQGETIQASKREIEQTLDTLNLAFEKLLDDLFQDTALDVSSDISVLQTLLAQEGLTEDEISRRR